MPRNRKTLKYVNMCIEILSRVVMAILAIILRRAEPFHRKIHPEEIWLYRNPHTKSYVPSEMLWTCAVGIPCTIFLICLVISRRMLEFMQAIMAFSLALCLNGIITYGLKLCVGRPRPDFFCRCFPNGEMNSEWQCTGDERIVRSGRKSFPSGHSSTAFVSMCFVALYLMGKLHVFTDRVRGQSWRLIVSITPLLLATLVAVSRTCDYRHHWQDITVGSLIGIIIAYVCYRLYYPAIGSTKSHLSYADIKLHDLNVFPNAVPSLPAETNA